MTEDLLCEIRENTAFLTINRESRRNAISREMIAAFLDRLDRLDRDPAVRAVCITAAGDKVFCSGADLAVTLSGGEEDRLAGRWEQSCTHRYEFYRKFAELVRDRARKVSGTTRVPTS